MNRVEEYVLARIEYSRPARLTFRFTSERAYVQALNLYLSRCTSVVWA